MKEFSIDKKVIVLTSYNTPDMIRKVSELGIDYFILKPFELSELEKRIENLEKWQSEVNGLLSQLIQIIEGRKVTDENTEAQRE